MMHEDHEGKLRAIQQRLRVLRVQLAHAREVQEARWSDVVSVVTSVPITRESVTAMTPVICAMAIAGHIDPLLRDRLSQPDVQTLFSAWLESQARFATRR